VVLASRDAAAGHGLSLLQTRAIVDKSSRLSADDVAEWREDVSAPACPQAFDTVLSAVQSGYGGRLLLAAIAPADVQQGDGSDPAAFLFGCPQTDGGNAQPYAVLSQLAVSGDAAAGPALSRRDDGWPGLGPVVERQNAVVELAAARQQKKGTEQKRFTEKLSKMAVGWDVLALEARGLLKEDPLMPFAERWPLIMQAAAAESKVKTEYDPSAGKGKRAQKAALELKKLAAADRMFEDYCADIRHFGVRWMGLLRSTLEDKVAKALHDHTGWLKEEFGAAVGRLGQAVKDQSAAAPVSTAWITP
jgi:hypothetical protein